MPRLAFKMKLKQGYEAEYKKRHDEIWPDLEDRLRNAGVYDYSIFFDKETLTLFSFKKLTKNNTADQISQTEIMKRWWEYMADIMETNADNSPITIQLQELYHLK